MIIDGILTIAIFDFLLNLQNTSQFNDLNYKKLPHSFLKMTASLYDQSETVTIDNER